MEDTWYDVGSFLPGFDTKIQNSRVKARTEIQYRVQLIIDIKGEPIGVIVKLVGPALIDGEPRFIFSSERKLRLSIE